jgi:hypothetical protein
MANQCIVGLIYPLSSSYVDEQNNPTTVDGDTTYTTTDPLAGDIIITASHATLPDGTVCYRPLVIATNQIQGSADADRTSGVRILNLPPVDVENIAGDAVGGAVSIGAGVPA